MNAHSQRLTRSNPFATRFIRPGAIAYVFADGQDGAGLARRLADLDWHAQIVGPHGSGKSTLVASLLPALERSGRPASVIALCDAQRRMPDGWLSNVRRQRARLIVVDGYEQLSRLSRTTLLARCRYEDLGILVTAHEEVGFPTLVRIEPSLAVTQAVVAGLLADGPAIIGSDAVAECFAANQGNLRETLFALYDRYERTAPRSSRESDGSSRPCAFERR